MLRAIPKNIQCYNALMYLLHRIGLLGLTCLCPLFAAPAIGAPDLPVDKAERRLLEIVNTARQGRWDEARALADTLVRKHPDFRAAGRLKTHIADRRLPETSGKRLLAPEDDEYLDHNLDAEIHFREQAARRPPADGAVASAVLRLDERIRYALLADLSRARLYLLENDNGLGRPVADYYAGMGKQGPGKQREGDHGTPVGIYRVTGSRPGDTLPPLYGAGALTLNYPNNWDRRQQRTGYGIWLHGVPKDTYSRPPYSSEGCVTVSNSIFDSLAMYAGEGETPVIIRHRAEWSEPGRQQQRAGAIRTALEQWRRDWAGLDFDAYIRHYSKRFDNGKENYQNWRRRKHAVNAAKDYIEVGLDNISIFRYPGEERLVQVNYRQHYASNNFNARTDKVQYWRKEDDGVWRIVYENPAR